MKKNLILVVAITLGYWLGNANFPQKHIQHALDYPRAVYKITFAENFQQSAKAHQFVKDSNYLSLEVNATAKMFELAKTAEDYLLISELTHSTDQQIVAIFAASTLANWSADWDAPGIKRYRKGKRIQKKEDTRLSILKRSFQIDPVKYLGHLKLAVMPLDPIQLNDFANHGLVFSEGIAAVQMASLPATSATADEWAKIRGVELLEKIAVDKIAERVTSVTELLSLDTNFVYGDIQDKFNVMAANRTSNFEECFMAYTELAMWREQEMQLKSRCLKFAKTKKQRDQIASPKSVRFNRMPGEPAAMKKVLQSQSGF